MQRYNLLELTRQNFGLFIYILPIIFNSIKIGTIFLNIDGKNCRMLIIINFDADI